MSGITASGGVCVPSAAPYDLHGEMGRPVGDSLPPFTAPRGPIFFANQWRERAVYYGLSDPPAVRPLGWWPWLDRGLDLIRAVPSVPTQTSRRLRAAWSMLRYGPPDPPEDEWWDDEDP